MEIIYWEDPKEISEQFTYDYWNHIEKEKTKDWFIQSKHEIDKIKNYLAKSGLTEEYLLVKDILEKR